MSRGPARARLAAAPESAVVALAMARDPAAFEELVRRRQGQIRTLLRRLCGDAGAAEDLAQETFLRAWGTIDQLRSSLALGAWLRQVAVSIWLQHARRRRLLTDPLEEHAVELDRRSAAVPEPAGERLDLQRGLAALRPAERLCVVLAHAEGMSHGEIAAAVGWPLGTVKSHVTRGSARLRAGLGMGEAQDERS